MKLEAFDCNKIGTFYVKTKANTCLNGKSRPILNVKQKNIHNFDEVLVD